MIKFCLYTVLALGLLFLGAGEHGSARSGGDRAITEHQVNLPDPAHLSDDLGAYIIFERKDADGLPVEYHMEVPSVYCLDSVCKVVSVRIYWGPIGDFRHFKVEKGFKLEKDKGKPFTRKDYKKLDQILHDKKSPFGGISIQEITKTSSSEGVDAVSGATTIVLDDDATIKGATLTCYTLWQWVNGEIVSRIRNLTGDAYTSGHFVNLLNGDDDERKPFALEQICRRRMYDDSIHSAVVGLAAGQNDEFVKPIRRYVDSLADEAFFRLAADCYAKGQGNLRIEMLQTILASDDAAGIDFYKELLGLIGLSATFREVDLYLKLLDKEDVRELSLIRGLVPFLDSNILIARRVYWYLSDMELPDDIRAKLVAFQQKNQDYL